MWPHNDSAMTKYIDRPLHLFNTMHRGFKNKQEPIGSALINFQSRWLRFCDWESRFSIRLKYNNTLKIKFKSVYMCQVQVRVYRSQVQVHVPKTGLEPDSSQSPVLEYYISDSDCPMQTCTMWISQKAMVSDNCGCYENHISVVYWPFRTEISRWPALLRIPRWLSRTRRVPLSRP